MYDLFIAPVGGILVSICLSFTQTKHLQVAVVVSRSGHEMQVSDFGAAMGMARTFLAFGGEVSKNAALGLAVGLSEIS